MLPVLDRPCLSYLITSLAKGGIEEVFLACGYRPEKMASVIGNGTAEGISIEYSYEDPPAGTAGAIKLLEDKLDDTFVACNGDVFADIDLKAEIDEHKRTNASLTISLTPVANPCEFGIARLDANNRILEFKEKPKPEEVFSNLVNAGVYVIEKEIMQYVPKDKMYDFSKDLTPKIMDLGYRVQGHMLNGMWMDVGRPKDLFESNILMAERLFANKEWDDVYDSKITKPFYLGAGGKVSGSNIMSSVISKGSVIENANISRSLIMADCRISGAAITGSILGERCTVKKGASITNAVLADGTIVAEGEIIENGRGQ
jgi:mannose-1-phosphate guanylyltransferase